MALDDDTDTIWNAQNFAAQWIAVKLDSLYLVDRIELVVAQAPAGPTSHVLWLGSGSGVRTLHKRLSNIHTEDGQTLTIEFSPPQLVDDLLVHTLESPSWVAWREVRVFGTPAADAVVSTGTPQLKRELIVGNLELPVQVTHAGDGSGRLFVVEQRGRIRIFKDGVENNQFFIDISGQITCCGERGLMNVAFSPDFASNQQFYLSYTGLDGDLVVSRFTAALDLESADPASEEVLLSIGQPHHAHNGGRMTFGPLDGYLYVGVGDGGSEDLPPHESQYPDRLLGKILRIDVESSQLFYAIPVSNPFVNVEGYRQEIWALGLRNPWGFAFDPVTGDLFIPDTGHSRREEVNFAPLSNQGGHNYGWPTIEGTRCLKISGLPVPCHQAAIFTLPVAEYERASGCAVVGGAVYRGDDLPHLNGRFLFSDFCRGDIWSLHRPAPDENPSLDGVTNEGWRAELVFKAANIVSSIGTDEDGSLYFVVYQPGAIYKISSR
ncbi:MAG: PQQ-dependent sugar dehydrogenase [Caldilineaceae bacterium]|nr:PQQ-dependent sugar dehydrogenase [Caldilineaceae bacterium]